MNILNINKNIWKLILFCLIFWLWLWFFQNKIITENNIQWNFQKNQEIKILNWNRKTLTQISNFSYQDENDIIYIRKNWKDVDWFTCDSNVWNEYIKVFWWDKYWSTHDCILLKEEHFITENQAKGEIFSSDQIIWKFKIDKIDVKIENFKDYQFKIWWKNIYLWDISLDNHYFLFENWDFIWKLYVLLFDQIKNKKVVLLEENNNEKMIIYTIRDDYQELIEYIKKRSKQILEISKKKKIHLKTNSKKEKLLAQVYETIINNVEYCFDCIENSNNTKIYDWMNWILTLKNKKWVCDWIVKSIIYVMNEWWYKIQKETWMWCSEDWCENHSWFVVNYNKKKKDWTKYKIKKYYDPTWDIQINKINKVKLDKYENKQILKFKDKETNKIMMMKSNFWIYWKEFKKTHKKDIFQR